MNIRSKSNRLFFALIFLLCGCNSASEIECIVRDMKSSSIYVDYSSFVCVKEGKQIDIDDGSSDLRLIVYSDTSYCSPCHIKRMYEWDTIVSYERKRVFSVDFIVGVKSEDFESVKEATASMALNHHIYIDTLNSFLNMNPCIPENSQFHTFLINKKGKILLIGNPLKNEKINSLLKKVISNEQKKEKTNEPA